MLPALRRLVGDAMTFLWTCISAWQAYLTGGAVQAIVNLYERQRGANIAWASYRWGVAAFLLTAVFVVWRKERRRAETAEERLKPQFYVVTDSDARYMDIITTEGATKSISEWHRIVIGNSGEIPIDDVHVFVHSVNGSEIRTGTVELQPTNVPDPQEDVRIFHDNPRAWDLVVYGYGDEMNITGRKYQIALNAPRAELSLRIVGANAPTMRQNVLISGEKGQRLTSVLV